MRRRPPRSTHTDTLFPYTTLFRSVGAALAHEMNQPLASVANYVRAARAMIDRQPPDLAGRSEEHTSELQSLMRTSYAVFRLKKKKPTNTNTPAHPNT